MMSFGDELRSAANRDEFDPPDGAYSNVRVVDGSAWTGPDGRRWGKVTLEIQDGEHKGRQFDDFMNFNNDVGKGRAHQNLSLYGVDLSTIETLEDLDTAMLELAGTVADVSVKHWAPEKINVAVTRSLTGESDIPNGQESFDTSDMQPATAQPRNAVHDDEEIPF